MLRIRRLIILASALTLGGVAVFSPRSIAQPAPPEPAQRPPVTRTDFSDSSQALRTTSTKSTTSTAETEQRRGSYFSTDYRAILHGTATTSPQNGFDQDARIDRHGPAEGVKLQPSFGENRPTPYIPRSKLGAQTAGIVGVAIAALAIVRGFSRRRIRR